MRVALTSVLASSSFFPAHSTAWLRRLAWEAVAIYSFFSLSRSLFRSLPPVLFLVRAHSPLHRVTRRSGE